MADLELTPVVMETEALCACSAFVPTQAVPAGPAAGDLVTLRSGGPVMTVADAAEGRVVVAWFDERKPEMQSATLRSQAVKVVGP